MRMAIFLIMLPLIKLKQMQAVSKILGFGGVGWNTATNLALNGTIYSYNSTFNAFFPADICIKTGSKCSAAGELIASQTWVNHQLE